MSVEIIKDEVYITPSKSKQCASGDCDYYGEKLNKYGLCKPCDPEFWQQA